MYCVLLFSNSRGFIHFFHPPSTPFCPSLNAMWSREGTSVFFFPIHKTSGEKKWTTLSIHHDNRRCVKTISPPQSINTCARASGIVVRDSTCWKFQIWQSGVSLTRSVTGNYCWHIGKTNDYRVVFFNMWSEWNLLGNGRTGDRGFVRKQKKKSSYICLCVWNSRNEPGTTYLGKCCYMAYTELCDQH